MSMLQMRSATANNNNNNQNKFAITIDHFGRVKMELCVDPENESLNNLFCPRNTVRINFGIFQCHRINK